MAFIVLGLFALALIAALIYVLGSPGKHAQMTEEEFEAEVKRGSLLGAAMIGVDKALRPNRVEHVLVQKKRVEKDTAVPDDPPVPGSDSNDAS